jgi:hypothetical protein
MATTESADHGNACIMPDPGELVITKTRPVNEATCGAHVWRRGHDESAGTFRQRVRLDVQNLRLPYVVFFCGKDTNDRIFE